MKKQFVNVLEEGDVVNDYYIATRKDLRPTQSGGKFLGMVFKDKSGEIGGVLWNNASAAAGQFELGDIVNVRGTVNSYQNRLQIRVDKVIALKKDEYDISELIFVPEDIDAVFAKFRALVESIQDPWLAKLVQAFLADDEFVRQFERAAAGKKWHHAFQGGLAQHCYEMARIAETMCELFPNIDRDMLMTGVFLHDIGKLEEMTHEIVVDYTTAGKLMGHLEIGCRMVYEKIATINDFPDAIRDQVIHLVLSHHGEKEMGSPVLPKTVEAIVLAHIDNLDAQTDAFTSVVKSTKQRGQEWSDYITMIDRQIWTKE